MSLEQRLKQLKEEQLYIEKEIDKKKKIQNELNKESSIEKLEILLEEQNTYLDYKSHRNSKSYREEINQEYINRKKQLENKYISNPQKYHITPTIKNELIRNNEMYITILGIFKKQREKIIKLESRIKKLTTH